MNESSIKSSTLWDDWFTVNVVSELTNSILTNQTSIRGGHQPVRSESDASENLTNEGVNERDATPSIKQTIKDALSEQVAMANKRDRTETRELHEIAIELPVKR